MINCLNMKKNIEKIIKILKNGGVGIMPTDTIYGLVGSAYSKKAVEKIYKIKNRDKNKPLIVLISSLSDLKIFGISIKIRDRGKCYRGIPLSRVFLPKISVILECPLAKFKYLHRGTKAIAFRLPDNKSLIEIIKATGPLVAPSANLENLKPAENITQAKKYFGDNVDFYLSGKNSRSQSSTIVNINKDSKVEVVRGVLTDMILKKINKELYYNND